MSRCLAEATGETYTFNVRECQLAMEEMIAEDFIPMFIQFCGFELSLMGGDDPLEIEAFRQERVEKCIEGLVLKMI